MACWSTSPAGRGCSGSTPSSGWSAWSSPAGASQESRDENRSRSIDYTGSVLIALTLGPLILALSKGSSWGWASAATIGCLVVAVLAAVAFVMVEKRVAVPLLDLALLRNRVLVGSTVAILIGAGTINALMYVLSLWFQDPSSLGFTPLQAGLATLPATVGLVVVAPLVPRFAARLGARQVVGLGFAITTAGFAVIGLADADWLYRAFVIPLIAIAVGMGMSNGPASSASTVVRPRRAGRVGIRGVEHGALRRRGGGDRAGRHRLQLVHRLGHG